MDIIGVWETVLLDDLQGRGKRKKERRLVDKENNTLSVEMQSDWLMLR